MQMKEKVVLLLPLTFNDGSEVPRPVLERIFEELFAAFNGYTIAGEVEGAYRMQSGAKQIDTCLEVWVLVEAAKELDSLRKKAAQFCKTLGQECLYFERTGALVELIPPEELKEAEDD